MNIRIITTAAALGAPAAVCVWVNTYYGRTSHNGHNGRGFASNVKGENRRGKGR